MKPQHGGEDLTADEHHRRHHYELGVGKHLHLHRGHAGHGGGRDGGEKQVDIPRPEYGSWVKGFENQEPKGGQGNEVENLGEDWINLEENGVVNGRNNETS